MIPFFLLFALVGFANSAIASLEQRRIASLGPLRLSRTPQSTLKSINGKSFHFDLQNSDPLVGCLWDGFSVESHVGSPDVRARLFVDTGSTTTGIATSTCSNCGVSTAFSPILASDAPTLHASYADGTGWLGRVTTERLTFDGMECAVQMRIGAITSQTGGSNFFGRPCAFNTSAQLNDGILGLGNVEIALPSTDALLDKLESPIFSMTTCDSVGELWLAAADTTNLIWNYADLRWIARNTPGFWGVQSELRLNNKVLDTLEISLVDSGTSLLLLPVPLYQTLQAALDTYPAWINTFGPLFWSRRVCVDLGNVNLTQIDESLPSLSVLMKDTEGKPVLFRLHPLRSLVVPYRIPSSGTVRNAYCPGVATTSSSIAIFGWSVLGQFGVVYDARRQRIGFSPINNLPCDAAVLSRSSWLPTSRNESTIPLCVSGASLSRKLPSPFVLLALLLASAALFFL